jgi:hypothetical protein
MIDGLLITVGFSFILFYNIKMIRKEMQESGKTLWQVLKKQSNRSRGYVFQPPQSNYEHSLNDKSYTSTDYATNPAFANLYGNINHRHTSPR